MTAEEEQLQQKSFQFIENNLDSTFDKIPDDLLYLWIEEEEDSLDESDDKCDEFTFFMYAFLTYNKRKGLKVIEQDQDEYFKIFNEFQTILKMAVISRTTDLHLRPIKIFDFNNYNRLQIYFI